MNEIIFFLAGFLLWVPIYFFWIIPTTARLSVERWKEWSLSDDGQETLIEVLGSEGGVIEHIAGTTSHVIKSMFEGGFGQVAKQLGNDPKIAMASGMADELKNMKWYESALLMKIAQSVPELQPLLGLAGGVKESIASNSKPTPSPAQASN
jgi:hypothetical protein